MGEDAVRRAVRRITSELMVWFIMASISLGISASLIGETAKSLRTYTTPHQFLVNTVLMGLATGWLILSLTLFINILRIDAKHGYFIAVKFRRYVPSTKEVVSLAKDVISLYRGYRWLIVVVSTLILIAGLLMLFYSTYYYITSKLGINEFLFRLFIGLITTSYATLSLYLEEKSIARRLAKVKSVEVELSKLLA